MYSEVAFHHLQQPRNITCKRRSCRCPVFHPDNAARWRPKMPLMELNSKRYLALQGDTVREQQAKALERLTGFGVLMSCGTSDLTYQGVNALMQKVELDYTPADFGCTAYAAWACCYAPDLLYAANGAVVREGQLVAYAAAEAAALPQHRRKSDPACSTSITSVQSNLAHGGSLCTPRREVATGTYVSDSVGTATVWHVATLPNLRKLGLGRAVMTSLCDQLVDAGYSRIGLRSTSKSVGFYTTLGWCTVQNAIDAPMVRGMPGQAQRLPHADLLW